jgi:hypothetical protein
MSNAQRQQRHRDRKKAEVLAEPATVEQLAERIHGRNKRILTEVVANGRDLIAARDLLPHGGWLPWLKKNFDWTERAAQRFMQVTVMVDAKSDSRVVFGDLPLSVVYVLAAPSTPPEVITEVIADRKAGMLINGDMVKRKIEEAKRPPITITETAVAEARPSLFVDTESVTCVPVYAKQAEPLVTIAVPAAHRTPDDRDRAIAPQYTEDLKAKRAAAEAQEPANDDGVLVCKVSQAEAELLDLLGAEGEPYFKLVIVHDVSSKWIVRREGLKKPLRGEGYTFSEAWSALW